MDVCHKHREKERASERAGRTTEDRILMMFLENIFSTLFSVSRRTVSIHTRGRTRNVTRITVMLTGENEGATCENIESGCILYIFIYGGTKILSRVNSRKLRQDQLSSRSRRQELDRDGWRKREKERDIHVKITRYNRTEMNIRR